MGVHTNGLSVCFTTRPRGRSTTVSFMPVTPTYYHHHYQEELPTYLFNTITPHTAAIENLIATKLLVVGQQKEGAVHSEFCKYSPNRMSNFATGLATANKLLYFFLFTTSCNARMIKSEQKAKEGMSGGEKRRKKKGGRIGYIHTCTQTGSSLLVFFVGLIFNCLVFPFFKKQIIPLMEKV